MKRAIPLLILLFVAMGFVSSTAVANGRRAMLKDANGNPTGITLVLCQGPTGGLFATLIAPDGTVICGPSRVRRIRPGVFVFDCNGSRFVFGCRAGMCGWRWNGRNGQLCPLP